MGKDVPSDKKLRVMAFIMYTVFCGPKRMSFNASTNDQKALKYMYDSAVSEFNIKFKSAAYQPRRADITPQRVLAAFPDVVLSLLSNVPAKCQVVKPYSAASYAFHTMAIASCTPVGTSNNSIIYNLYYCAKTSLVLQGKAGHSMDVLQDEIVKQLTYFKLAFCNDIIPVKKRTALYARYAGEAPIEADAEFSSFFADYDNEEYIALCAKLDAIKEIMSTETEA